MQHLLHCPPHTPYQKVLFPLSSRRGTQTKPRLLSGVGCSASERGVWEVGATLWPLKARGPCLTGPHATPSWPVKPVFFERYGNDVRSIAGVKSCFGFRRPISEVCCRRLSLRTLCTNRLPTWLASPLR